MNAVRALTLCLVTDRRRLSPSAATDREAVEALDRWLDEAIGVVDMIQIREADLDGRVLLGLATRLAARARGSTTAVVVNERADVALAAGAAGVHLPATGPQASRVRGLSTRAGWLVGRSIHSREEVGVHGDADYFVFGTVFPSASKSAEARCQGIGGLSEVTKASRLPVLAIGGIDPQRAAECHAAGASGVAAIGLFLPPDRAPNGLGIRAAAAALRTAVIP